MNQMRELFEKWAIDNGHSIGKYVNEFHQGEYLSEYTAFAWMAWQAAQSAAELAKIRAYIADGIESEGVTEHDHSIEARKLVKLIDAAIAGETNHG